MFRLRNILLLAFAATTAKAALELNNLRAQNDVESVDVEEVGDVEGWDVKAKFSMEKQISCEGGCSKKKGEGKTCKGHMKKAFTAGFVMTDMAEDMATELSNEFSNMLPTQKEDFVPSDLGDVTGFDDLNVEDVEEGFSKSMEYVGSVKADWKCTVTYTKKLGKMGKTIECGFASTDGTALANTADSSVEEQE